MKRFFQFAMVAAATLAFVACGNNAAAPEAATEEVAVVEGTEACCEHGEACDSTKVEAGEAIAEAAVEATEEAAE